MELLGVLIKSDGENLVKTVNGVVQLNIGGSSGEVWTVDLKHDKGSVTNKAAGYVRRRVTDPCLRWG